MIKIQATKFGRKTIEAFMPDVPGGLLDKQATALISTFKTLAEVDKSWLIKLMEVN